MSPRAFVIVAVAALFGLGFLLVCAAALLAAEPVAITVTPKRAIAGADIRVVVRIQPDSANRRLTLVVDGAGYWSGSDVELEPETRIVDRTFHKLPEGRYDVIAGLVRAGGQSQRAVEWVCLNGPNEDCADGGGR